MPNDYTIPLCLRETAAVKCDVFVEDLKGDGSPQIFVVQGGAVSGFDRDAGGTWRLAGRWNAPCGDTSEALRRGDFTAAVPETPSWPDIEVAGRRLHFAPNTIPNACKS